MTIPIKIKNLVRERANHRCEYCLKPSMISDVHHQIDHIIPKRHHGTDELENLALACFECNNAKGYEIGAYDFATGIIVPFYNPRTQQWDEHFEISDYLIVGKTPNGRVTVQFLNMNIASEISMRRDLIMSGKW